ncbi:MAG: DUF924 domain-containing protein [Alphaproteobacteria bacterium]|nr:DUF924 domain-containing protein [Alphaproteobacteria bacterium]
METPNSILEFWFGSASHPQFQPFWFSGGVEVDQVIQERFGSLYEGLLKNRDNGWQSDTTGALALVLLFDQFPRHLFRGTAQMFQSDVLALEIAKSQVDQERDKELPALMRSFLYLPFEHSEDLEDQRRSILLFEALGNSDFLAYAESHYRTIERFGRFPHRNALLGRASHADEVAFLQSPPSGFFSG